MAPISITDSIDRRRASAQPILTSDFSSENAPLIKATVVLLSTYQCETSSARAPA
jgi:hypothetical protein